MNTEPLAQELRDLGRAVQIPSLDADALTARTMARLAEPVRATAAGRRRWRWPSIPRRRRQALAGAVAGLIIVLALTPPVRAAVADWFGVIVRSGAPAESEPIPHAGPSLSLADARELVSFEPVEPQTLGTPDGVEVSPDGRVLSMTWSDSDGGVIRLDQFSGVEPIYLKESQRAAEMVDVDDTTALWFDGPHHVVRLDEDGREYVETARSAGPTLIMPVGEVTVRIDGLDRSAAIETARSLTGTD
jgi:hypothetical protein